MKRQRQNNRVKDDPSPIQSWIAGINKRLAMKIGLAVIVTELLVLALVSAFYITRFSHEQTDRLITRVGTPGKLMGQGVLRYESISNRQVMRELVGEELLDALIIGVNRHIYYALNPQEVGKSITDIRTLPLIERLSLHMTHSQTSWANTRNGRELVNITPIMLEDGRLIGFLYIRTGTQVIARNRLTLITVFLAGTLLCVLLTSLMIFRSFTLLIFTRIQETLQVVEDIAHGHLSSRIPEPISPDEIGGLQHGMNMMANTLAQRRAEQDLIETKLKEADQAKNQFLMVLSHELKTPLTSIIGWTQLAETAPDLVPEALEVILRNAREQRDMLERLIILSRILTGRLDLRPITMNLWQVAEDAVEYASPGAQGHRITLQAVPPAMPLMVKADPVLTRRAIDEVMTNAVKFTPAGGTVTISGQQEQQWGKITVHDTGRGFTQAQQTLLMQPFQQLQRLEEYGGLGIGLALLKGIIEAQGGKVSVTSAGIDQGSTVTVLLPWQEHLQTIA